MVMWQEPSSTMSANFVPQSVSKRLCVAGCVAENTESRRMPLLLFSVVSLVIEERGGVGGDLFS